jgi:hypothetical protein
MGIITLTNFSKQLSLHPHTHHHKSALADAASRRRRAVCCSSSFLHGQSHCFWRVICDVLQFVPSHHPSCLQAIKKKRPAIPTLPPAATDNTGGGGASLVLTSSGWKGDGVAAKAPPLVIPMSQSTFVVGRVSYDFYLRFH